MALGHVLMTLLHQQSASGYELSKSFDELPGHFWHVSHQQIYRELARLEKRGWVSFLSVLQTERPDKKVYSLTPVGRGELETWLQEPPARVRSNDEGLVKLLGADLIGIEALKKQLEQQHKGHKQRLADYLALEHTHYPDGTNGMPLFQRMAWLSLRKGISLEQARLAWTEEALAHVSRW